MQNLLRHLKGYRKWGLIIMPIMIIWLFWYLDPDRRGKWFAPDTFLRLELLLWLLAPASLAYVLRKSLFHGDSREAWMLVKEGNVAGGLYLVAVGIFTGLVLIAFSVIIAKGETPPEKSLPWLPVLQQEASQYWPDNPSLAVLAAQPEQETCPSLHSKGCWNPHAGFKTSREEGIGLGQITITSKYDNLAAARTLDSSLHTWAYEQRYDGRRQLRAMILMDRASYKKLSMIQDKHQRNKMALSAYNGGLGGLLNDRRLCDSIDGCNPDMWDGNVELHSLKSHVKYKGYGKSFFEINREYPKNIYWFRADHYREYFNENS